MDIKSIYQLHKPTPEQTLNFVQKVAVDHSWYKHLSATRSTLFYFYLDPNVEREIITTEKRKLFGKEVLFNIKNPQEDIPAKEYQKKYGCWKYYIWSYDNTPTKFYYDYLIRHPNFMLIHYPKIEIGLNIIDPQEIIEPLQISKLKTVLQPIPDDWLNKILFKMSRYIHPVFKNIVDLFDDEYPEKSYAQMHNEIISELTNHLISLTNIFSKV